MKGTVRGDPQDLMLRRRSQRPMRSQTLPKRCCAQPKISFRGEYNTTWLQPSCSFTTTVHPEPKIQRTTDRCIVGFPLYTPTDSGEDRKFTHPGGISITTNCKARQTASGITLAG